MISGRFTSTAVESVRKQVKYPHNPMVMPRHTYSEVKKIGDRKIFFFCSDVLYDFYKEKEIEMVKDLFGPSRLKVKESDAPPGEGLPLEMKNFIEKSIIEGVERGKKALKKYEHKIKPKEYNVEDIIEKTDRCPMVIPIPSMPVVFTSSNKDVNKYYDWRFYPHIEMVIPSTKSYKEFLISEISPTVKHELLHTIHGVTSRTEVGKDIHAMELFMQQGMSSCADMSECAGIDLAFYMEGWGNLGNLCKKSVDSYQEEIGDVSWSEV